MSFCERHRPVQPCTTFSAPLNSGSAGERARGSASRLPEAGTRRSIDDEHTRVTSGRALEHSQFYAWPQALVRCLIELKLHLRARGIALHVRRLHKSTDQTPTVARSIGHEPCRINHLGLGGQASFDVLLSPPDLRVMNSGHSYDGSRLLPNAAFCCKGSHKLAVNGGARSAPQLHSAPHRL